MIVAGTARAILVMAFVSLFLNKLSHMFNESSIRGKQLRRQEIPKYKNKIPKILTLPRYTKLMAAGVINESPKSLAI